MPKEPRTETIIFRVRKSHHDLLVKEHKRIKIRDVNTEDQFVRKLLLDFLDGHLLYNGDEHRSATPNG